MPSTSTSARRDSREDWQVYQEPVIAPKTEARLVELARDKSIPESLRAACREAASMLSGIRDYNNLLRRHGPGAHQEAKIGSVSVANSTCEALGAIKGLPQPIHGLVQAMCMWGRGDMTKVHKPGSVVSYDRIVPIENFVDSCTQLANSAAATARSE